MPFDNFQWESLKEFEEIMESHPQDYAYTGSAAMVLHGMDAYPSDIDMVASEETFDELDRLLVDEEPKPVDRTDYFGRGLAYAIILEFEVGPTEFEAMKNARYKVGGENFDVSDAETETVNHHGRDFEVVVLDDLKKIYRMGGREEKAERIEKYQGRQELEERDIPREPLDFIDFSPEAKEAFFEQQTNQR